MGITLFAVKHPKHGYVAGSGYTADINEADISTIFSSARVTITEPFEFVVVLTRDNDGNLVEVYDV